MGRISHAVAIFTIAAFAAAHPAQGQAKERAPRFADYPVTKLVHMKVAKAKVPKSWDEDPRLRLEETVAHLHNRTNFAGRYFVAIVGCGSTCVWGAIVHPKTGRIVAGLPSVSSWFDTHDKFKAIDFRHNSRLIVMSGAREEKKTDMGRHFYVFENGRLRFLKSIKQKDANFMEPNK